MICKSREFQFIPKVVKQLLGLTLVLSSLSVQQNINNCKMSHSDIRICRYAPKCAKNWKREIMHKIAFFFVHLHLKVQSVKFGRIY